MGDPERVFCPGGPVSSPAVTFHDSERRKTFLAKQSDSGLMVKVELSIPCWINGTKKGPQCCQGLQWTCGKTGLLLFEVDKVESGV